MAGKQTPGDATAQRASMLRLPGRKEPVEPTGVLLVDALANRQPPSLSDYIVAVSEYVRRSADLTAGAKKAAQLRLSFALGQVLVTELRARIPQLRAQAGERRVAGALRTVKADVSEYHELDGLRLAVEIKPVNLAVGRAIWNRFGDIRAFAVNLHLKFPFAVVGGVLVIPTYEITKKGAQKPTLPLITRTIGRLVRAGRRRNESDGAHLLEGIGVIVYDPETGEMRADLPPRQSGLRWEEFVTQLAEAYDTRFGEEAEPSPSAGGAGDQEPDQPDDDHAQPGS